MADTILVIAEQREGKLNRVSLETITAAQAIAAETGWTVEGAVFGSGVAGIAGEIAAKKLAKVYAIESDKLQKVYAGWRGCRLERLHQPESAQAGADAAYISGARLCSQAGHRTQADADQ